MSSTAAQKGQRGTRVRLGGSVLALSVLENGRQVRGRMSQLSVNGGLLSLENPLDEGIRITVLFHIGNTTIRCRGQMLFPMWATQGMSPAISLPGTARERSGQPEPGARKPGQCRRYSGRGRTRATVAKSPVSQSNFFRGRQDLFQRILLQFANPLNRDVRLRKLRHLSSV